MPPPTHFRTKLDRPHLWVLAASLFLTLGAVPSFSQQSETSEEPPVVLDQVVAVVNNQAILSSDVDQEIRLAILDPGEAGLGVLTPQRALEQLIGRALIQQQIRQEEERAADPSEEMVKKRLNEIRTELPACVRQNCATDDGWKKFLVAHGLTAQRVESYLRYRLQILGFIEMRFRQGIQIPAADTEQYYRETLLPQYAAGEKRPTLESVAPRIEEILLQRQVSILFDDWLKNLRQQGDIEVLDPSLETVDPKSPANGPEGPVIQ